MKKNLIFLFASISFSAFGQLTAGSEGNPRRGDAERLTVFVNANRFIPGERIFFKLENRLASGQPSTFSRVAYVELIDSSKQAVIRNKVLISEGRGQGHLYLPSFLKTGNYTVIVYTAWMLNYSRAIIPQLGIQLTNPFDIIPAFLQSDSLSMTFLPEGHAWVRGKLNRVALQLDAPVKGQKKKVFFGKVLSPSGETVATFKQPENQSFGHFDITPAEVGLYKIIVSDDVDGIWYFDLPIDTFQNSGLRVADQGDRFVFNLTNQTGISHRLKISEMDQNIIRSINIEQDTSLSVLKSDLPTGLLEVKFANGYRVIYNSGQVRELKVSLTTGNVIYRTRQKVKIKLDASNMEVSNVAVSVRKVYDNNYRERYSSGLWEFARQLGADLFNDFLIVCGDDFSSATEPDRFFPPEVHGQFITGRILSEPQRGNTVFISNTAAHPILRTGTVDANGNFVVPIPTFYGDESFLVFAKGAPTVDAQEAFLKDHDFVSVVNRMDRTKLDWLERKSIDVQVEDAYFIFKADRALEGDPQVFLKEKVDKQFDFDAYTRFPTMRQTILENIADLRTRDNNGQVSITMPFVTNKSSPVDSALVLVDGIPVNSGAFLELDPARFSAVDFITQQVNLGYVEYRGVAMFRTFAGNALTIPSGPEYHSVSIMPFQRRFKYFTHQLENSLSRMPDHRSQLLWEPNFDLTGDGEIEFYTSDLIGLFEITVHGLDSQGLPISSRTIFEVGAQ